jgi:hypothetical protein
MDAATRLKGVFCTCTVTSPQPESQCQITAMRRMKAAPRRMFVRLRVIPLLTRFAV